ncbi:MAG: hypothetical protein ACREAE_07485 [Nitrosopumilaceae archaeon]
MLNIALNASKYSIPTTLTAAALYVGPFQLPLEYHSMPHFAINRRPWEEQYIPKALDANVKMERIHKFAVALLQDTEDIPEEFAKILNEDFWEII